MKYLYTHSKCELKVQARLWRCTELIKQTSKCTKCNQVFDIFLNSLPVCESYC